MFPPAAPPNATASALNSGVNLRRFLLVTTNSFRISTTHDQVSVKPGQPQVVTMVCNAPAQLLGQESRRPLLGVVEDESQCVPQSGVQRADAVTHRGSGPAAS